MGATSPITQHKSQVLIGSGELFIDVLDDAGDTTGERYIGDSPGFVLNVTEDRTQVRSNDGPTGQDLINRVIGKTFAGTVTVQDVSADNLALMLSGEVERRDGHDGGTDVLGPVVGDRWYQLGITRDDPTGVQEVLTVKVKMYADKAAATANNGLADADGDEGDDFEWDERGRVYVKKVTANKDWWAATYTVAAADDRKPQAIAKASLALKDVRAAVRYVEDSADPGGKSVYIPYASIGSSGDTSFKDGRQNPVQITLTLGIQKPPNGMAAVYVYGEAL